MGSGDGDAASVESVIEQLRAAGFVPVLERGSGQVNRLIELQRPDFAVRLTGDRGQWWVEGGLPGGSEWYDASIWEACLTDSPPGGSDTLEEQAAYFVLHHAELAAAATRTDFWNELARCRERRARERLGLPPSL
jgi:hypothetical protein